jgi:large subunit ribosomal protein L30
MDKVNMEQVRITLIKSMIDRPKRQKDTLAALGISKREQSVTKPKNGQIMGMVNKVNHLVKVETVQ